MIPRRGRDGGRRRRRRRRDGGERRVAGVHRAPEFVRRPRDASGRPRAMGEGGRAQNIRRGGRAPIRSVVALVDDTGAGALRGEFAKQFWALKRKLMDCVVMVRHGSFYNMFDVDADAGMAVGLRLTGNNGGFIARWDVEPNRSMSGRRVCWRAGERWRGWNRWRTRPRRAGRVGR